MDKYEYVGKTQCPLETVEQHHREYKLRGYSETPFRLFLIPEPPGEFVWLVEPYMCTESEINDRCFDLIQQLQPTFNSKTYKAARTNQYSNVKRMRGVYGFKSQT